ncbi:MAG: hypothetical protein HZA78_05290 [Candidatus Schekmanbacteria bacterium]|nr:hypothetical protein [Candidatus Schekmanbacteria bacterium]
MTDIFFNLNFHDITVSYKSNNELFSDELALEFVQCATKEKSIRTDIRINFYDLDLNPGLADKIDALRSSKHKIQEAKLRECLVQIIDLTDFSINIWVKGDWNIDQTLLIVVGALGGMLKLKLQPKLRLAGFHAAALAWNNRGVLLPGDTGAGKTTLAYRCIQAGFGYLSDEDSLIANPASENSSQPLQILAYPRRLRLSREITALYPQLVSKHHSYRPYQIFDQSGFIFNLYKTQPKAYLQSVTLTTCVILNNDRSYTGVPEITLPGKAKARFALLHFLESITFDSDAPVELKSLYPNRQGFYLVDTIFESITIYELRYNICDHLDLIPEFLKETLL